MRSNEAGMMMGSTQAATIAVNVAIAARAARSAVAGPYVAEKGPE